MDGIYNWKWLVTQVAEQGKGVSRTYQVPELRGAERVFIDRFLVNLAVAAKRELRSNVNTATGELEVTIT